MGSFRSFERMKYDLIRNCMIVFAFFTHILFFILYRFFFFFSTCLVVPHWSLSELYISTLELLY